MIKCIFFNTFRCNVTCEGRQLHNINSYQFIDSPEWMASTLMHGEPVFQVYQIKIILGKSFINCTHVPILMFLGNDNSCRRLCLFVLATFKAQTDI